MTHEIQKSLIQLDRFCDYIPPFAIVSNLVVLIIKAVVVDTSASSPEKSPLMAHLQQKSYTRCLSLIFCVFASNVYFLVVDEALQLPEEPQTATPPPTLPATPEPKEEEPRDAIKGFLDHIVGISLDPHTSGSVKEYLNNVVAENILLLKCKLYNQSLSRMDEQALIEEGRRVYFKSFGEDERPDLEQDLSYSTLLEVLHKRFNSLSNPAHPDHLEHEVFLARAELLAVSDKNLFECAGDLLVASYDDEDTQIAARLGVQELEGSLHGMINALNERAKDGGSIVGPLKMEIVSARLQLLEQAALSRSPAAAVR